MENSEVVRDITITAKYIPILAEFMAVEDIRYYLNGIFVEPCETGGIYLVSTNGHMLCVIHDAEGKTNGKYICSLPPKIVKACTKKNTKNDIFRGAEVLRFIGDAGHVLARRDADPKTLSIMHLETAYCKVIEGNFPNWRKVIPKEYKPCDRVGVNAQYLAAIEKAARGGCYGYSPVSLFMNDADSAILIRPDAMPEMVMICMPMRSEYSPATPPIPDWLLSELNKQIPEEEKKAA